MHESEYRPIRDGRIRIKVPEVKDSPAMAGEIESQLAKLEGVAHVKANLLTGSVLVLFDAQVISYYQVFAMTNDLAYLPLLLGRPLQPVRRTRKKHDERMTAFRKPTARVGER